jgi:hypothetical protein
MNYSHPPTTNNQMRLFEEATRPVAFSELRSTFEPKEPVRVGIRKKVARDWRSAAANDRDD